MAKNFTKKLKEIKDSINSFVAKFIKMLVKDSAKKPVDPIKNELLGLITASLAVLVVISLLSFSEFDTQRAFGDDFDNLLGAVGSHLALNLLIYFGIFSAIFPALLFALSLKFFIGEKQYIKRGQLFGVIIVLFTFMPLSRELIHTPLMQTFLISGDFGEEIWKYSIYYFSHSGLFFIALTLLLCSVVLIINRPIVMPITRWLMGKYQKQPMEANLSILPPIEEPFKTPAPHGPTILPPKEMPEPKKTTDIKLPILSDIQIVERNVKTSLSELRKAENESGRKIYSFQLPPLNLLDYDAPDNASIDPAKLKKEADKLQRAFLQYGIEGKIREIRPGPVVTNYEFVPAPGIKLSRIAALSDDIAMAMSAVQVRIVTPIPGKGAVGIEVPNEKRETVYLKEIVADERYRKMSHKLAMAIGKDVEGMPYYMNLADMPHVLIAGTTGSGKSVSVNAMICSILYRATPNDVRFLMIDPKMLELSIYNGIPHLLLPPIIDAKKAANALRWAVKEMDQRYNLMKEAAVRDIVTYNEKIKKDGASSLRPIEGRNHEHLPYIVIVVDEYADLLAIAGKEVEGFIMRLAQKARASGIHVMLATQRPSVDVITGVIKANFPVRMGFRLASAHDSKTIINKNGAEKLLGRGDALIMPPGTSDIFRVHGAFISEKELSRVVEFLSAQKPPDYREEIANFEEQAAGSQGALSGSAGQDLDEKFQEALAVVREHNRCSTSFIQRHLSVGYNRAAKMVEEMERQGLVGPVLNARGEREIFMNEKT